MYSLRFSHVLALTLLAFVSVSLKAQDALTPPVECTIYPAPEGVSEGAVWPGGIVPFIFDPSTNATHQQKALDAMLDLEAVAGIRFVPRTTEPNYLVIEDGNGNSSFVGMIGGPQTVTIVSWGSKFIIVHEFMHALSLWHEQQRPDRDQFVTIHPANIRGTLAPNFDIHPNATVHGPYDFDSVMHYDACAFSICCPPGIACNCDPGCETITVNPPNQQWQSLIGQRDHLSDGDRATLRNLYSSSSFGWLAEPQSAPSARMHPGMVFDGVQILMFGGFGGTTSLNDTWLWRRGVWTEITGGTAPGPRDAFAMAYDSNRQKVVLFGGEFATSGARFNDTWEWDGVQQIWTDVTPLTGVSPPVRSGAQLVFDKARGQMILFGGEFMSGGTYNDMWFWTGSEWTQRDPIPGEPWPEARSYHGMVYDEARGRVVLFGGQRIGGGTHGDTWEWDGSRWELVTSTGPSARYVHAMAYDAARQRTLLFGGSSGAGETWAWYGSTWIQIDPQVCPPNDRRNHRMAFDQDSQSILMFGGGQSSSPIGELWRFWHCYADCDKSTGVGTLDIFDFLHFQNAFVRSDPYACDCDTSSGCGVCDVFDFLCFQNAFVTGCP